MKNFRRESSLFSPHGVLFMISIFFSIRGVLAMGDKSTPVEVAEFLSPSSNDICIICYEDLQKMYEGKPLNRLRKG